MRETDAAFQPRARQLFDQIRRAAISVEANIVEGYALHTAPQFRRHLRIALASAAEVECLVAIARELAYFPDEVAARIAESATHTIRLITGLIRAIR